MTAAPASPSFLPRKQRIGIDRGAVIPFLARLHPVDGEMEVGAGGVGVAGRADSADRVALPDRLALVQARRVILEVGIIEKPAAVGRAHIGRDAAPALAE